MSNDADLEYGPTPADSEYEHTDIEPGIAGRFAFWLAIAMVISAGLMYGSFWLLEGREQGFNAEIQQFPLAAGQIKVPPRPRLQTQPFRDVYELKRGQVDKLTTYGWVDQGAGVVHIPIEEAMRIVSERGTIGASPTTPQGLNELVQDTSSGRTSARRY